MMIKVMTPSINDEFLINPAEISAVFIENPQTLKIVMTNEAEYWIHGTIDEFQTRLNK